MTDDKHSSHVFHPRPFEDGHAITYTIREIYDGNREFQSQHHDLAAAADAFMLACLNASCVELRDTDGRVIAGYLRGQGRRRVQGGAP
jgi:hypothetical protein